MSANNPEASSTPAGEGLSFEENLKVEREALAEELSDRLIRFRDKTGVADLYVAKNFVQAELGKALELALEKDRD